MGRGPENDLVIDDPMVSRIHARIEFDGKGWILRDLGSSNGTRVNGSPVGSVVLSAGDVIKVGESSLEFRR
jgi:pSer/pThr/pTyr-binding forkhead associated (FHA) protein